MLVWRLVNVLHELNFILFSGTERRAAEIMIFVSFSAGRLVY